MALGRIADTSWLYAVFNEDDEHHEPAVAMLYEPVVTLVPSAILGESLDLIGYRHGRDAARRAYGDLVSFPHFDLWYPVDDQAAAGEWLRTPGLSVHDAHAVACALATGFPLATFDKRQEKALSA